MGLLCMGLGSLVWTLPHFATPPYVGPAGDTSIPAGEANNDLETSINKTEGLCGVQDQHYESEILPNDSQDSSSLQNYR